MSPSGRTGGWTVDAGGDNNDESPLAAAKAAAAAAAALAALLLCERHDELPRIGPLRYFFLGLDRWGGCWEEGSRIDMGGNNDEGGGS